MTAKSLRGEHVTREQVEKVIGTSEVRRASVNRVSTHEATSRHLVHLENGADVFLGRHPPYVVHNLRHCARRVLEAPRAVFSGLRGGAAFNGRAYCGLPVWTYDNFGKRIPAPEGKVYVVYLNDDDTVFDWDWVSADKTQRYLPVNHEGRFSHSEKPVSLTLPDMSLPDNQFDPTVGVHSAAGDCVFAYFSDEPAIADRANEELTVFRSIRTNEPVGCKIKNIAAIIGALRGGSSWSTSSEDIEVRLILAESYQRQAKHKTLRMPAGYTELFKSLEDFSPMIPMSHVPENGSGEIYAGC